MSIVTTLASVGITPAQIIGFLLTIIAAFLSARWGGAESRRQFRAKETTDKKAAAMELIPLLMQFAATCEQKRGNLSTFMSSNGHDGTDEGMQGLEIDAKIRSSAAKLSNQVAERVIRLEVMRDRAVTYFTSAADYFERDELDEKLLSFFALLALKARYVVDLAGAEVGFQFKFPREHMDKLLEAAMKHSSEIDSGDDKSWF